MRLRGVLVACALAVLLAPAPARADWIVTPFVGTNWSSNSTTDHRVPFGASLAWMGGGIAGFEAQLSYTNQFFDSSDVIGTNNVVSVMANLIVGAPLGGSSQIRPYATGGVGLLRSRIGGAATDVFDITTNDFGMNVGGGVMGFFNPRVGIRGDLRYYRSLNGADQAPFASEPGRFHFWQGTIGVAFKF